MQIRKHVVRHDVGSPAYWLALGSAGTANDLAKATKKSLSQELERLADNFLQLAEMAASEWDRSVRPSHPVIVPLSKKHRLGK